MVLGRLRSWIVGIFDSSFRRTMDRNFGLKRRQCFKIWFDVNRDELSGTFNLHGFPHRKIQVGDITMIVQHLYQNMIYFLFFHNYFPYKDTES